MLRTVARRLSSAAEAESRRRRNPLRSPITWASFSAASLIGVGGVWMFLNEKEKKEKQMGQTEVICDCVIV